MQTSQCLFYRSLQERREGLEAFHRDVKMYQQCSCKKNPILGKTLRCFVTMLGFLVEFFGTFWNLKLLLSIF